LDINGTGEGTCPTISWPGVGVTDPFLTSPSVPELPCLKKKGITKGQKVIT